MNIPHIAWGIDYISRRYAGTPEQQADAYEAAAQREIRRLRVRPGWQSWWENINAVPNAAVRAVLTLHQPGRDGRTLECTECHDGGPADYMAAWPCQTLLTVARAIHMPPPDSADVLQPDDLWEVR